MDPQSPAEKNELTRNFATHFLYRIFEARRVTKPAITGSDEGGVSRGGKWGELSIR